MSEETKEEKKPKHSYLILILVILIAGLLLALILTDYQNREAMTKIEENKESQEEENIQGKPGEETYPDDLLEGTIVAIQPELITINAKVSKIVPGAANTEKNIKITSETAFDKYFMETEERVSSDFNELQVNDFILAVVKESTHDEVLKSDTFTATKITLMK